MVDPTTGEITFALSSARLGPGLMRDDFLSSELGRAARPVVISEPHATYGVEVGPGELAAQPFWLELQFHKTALDAVQLVLQAPEFGHGWSEWSEERETARKAAHDRWLIDADVAPGSYAWGTVESEFDKRSGGSVIIVRYRWQGRPCHSQEGARHR
jgi:hypothetical protein